MHINKSRVRSLDRYLKGFKANEKIVVALRNIEDFAVALANAGFHKNLVVGESVLPSGMFGAVSAFNAHGRYHSHKDQPMETVYRPIYWTWHEFRGRYDKIEKSDVRYVSYQRYPRTFLPPVGLELEVAADKDDNKLIVSPSFDTNPIDQGLLHAVNLFLEIFGECDLLTSSLEAVHRAKVIRLNWHLLPPGQLPWKQLRQSIDPIVDKAPGGNQPLIQRRLETIHSYQPDFQAIGRGGFDGYVVFGFKKKNLYVLESAFVGNATYVFENGWETLSTLTKAEILGGNLQKARIVHLQNWNDDIHKMLK